MDAGRAIRCRPARDRDGAGAESRFPCAKAGGGLTSGCGSVFTKMGGALPLSLPWARRHRWARKRRERWAPGELPTPRGGNGAAAARGAWRERGACCPRPGPGLRELSALGLGVTSAEKRLAGPQPGASEGSAGSWFGRGRREAPCHPCQAQGGRVAGLWLLCPVRTVGCPCAPQHRSLRAGQRVASQGKGERAGGLGQPP